jgi:hypothetical protein
LAQRAAVGCVRRRAAVARQCLRGLSLVVVWRRKGRQAGLLRRPDCPMMADRVEPRGQSAPPLAFLKNKNISKGVEASTAKPIQPNAGTCHLPR